MPIKLKNKGRSPLVLELPSLGLEPQKDIRVGRDPKTGAKGVLELQRTYPRSVTIPGRGESEVLPDEVAGDSALAAWAGVVEVVEVKVPIASGDAPKEK